MGSRKGQLGQKKSKFIVRSKFLAAEFFSLHRYFIETATTDIDMLFASLVAILQ